MDLQTCQTALTCLPPPAHLGTMTLRMVMVQSLMCRVWQTSHSDTYSDLHSRRHWDTGLALF